MTQKVQVTYNAQQSISLEQVQSSMIVILYDKSISVIVTIGKM